MKRKRSKSQRDWHPETPRPARGPRIQTSRLLGVSPQGRRLLILSRMMMSQCIQKISGRPLQRRTRRTNMNRHYLTQYYFLHFNFNREIKLLQFKRSPSPYSERLEPPAQQVHELPKPLASPSKKRRYVNISSGPFPSTSTASSSSTDLWDVVRILSHNPLFI